MKPELVLLTLSGAHATGKTTLARDVRDVFAAQYGEGAAVHASSFTGALFKRLRDGTVTVPGYDGAAPQVYDDLNRLGLRVWYQRQLPGACVFEIEAAVARLSGESHYNLVVTDRWFPDILSYTAIECPNDAAMYADIAALCRESRDSVLLYLRDRFSTLVEVNALVPLAASGFSAIEQPGKFRATGRRDVFEQTCLRSWAVALGYSARPYRVLARDRSDRVTEMMRLVHAHVVGGRPEDES